MTWFKTPEELNNEQKAKLSREVKKQRKEAEAFGVVINDVRYAGTPGNRQDLSEAIEFAHKKEITEFLIWKDSDDTFHLNHPVAEVEQAREEIASRRSEMIALEGKYQSQIMSGEITSVDNLDWSIE